MFTIRMDCNKSLYAVSSNKIFQGEHDADTWQFLVPKQYEDTDLTLCSVFLHYLDRKGNQSSIELMADDVEYEDVTSYLLPISDIFTSTINQYAFWLEIKKSDGSFILKTAPIFVPIDPSEPIIPVDEDQLPDLVELWQQVMEGLYQDTKALHELYKNKADNIQTNEDGTVQLVSEGKLIGNSIQVGGGSLTWKPF